MRHVTHIYESCHTYERVMSHIQKNSVALVIPHGIFLSLSHTQTYTHTGTFIFENYLSDRTYE